MPMPRNGYYLKDGTRVPGTTTVIGRFKESGALLRWAFQQGKDGKNDLYEDRDKAADIGTCVHNMVERNVRGGGVEECRAMADEILPTPEMRAKAMSGFDAYLAWARNCKIEIIAQEIQMVSEAYRFGGTPDAIGKIGDDLVLLDYKTSNGVYTDYLIQLAAYKNLWEENHPDKPINGGFHLLRFAKEHGDFAHHYYAKLDEAWRQFVLLREAYEIDKQLKKRAS